MKHATKQLLETFGHTEQIDGVRRSIFIDKKHQNFVNDNKLNLSKIIRAHLDELMNSNKRSK